DRPALHSFPTRRSSDLIGVVPLRYAGALHRVYPGFVQLAAFMSMNLQRHIRAQIDLFCHLANGEDAQAAAIRAFYDEYCAVMDRSEEHTSELQSRGHLV